MTHEVQWLVVVSIKPDQLSAFRAVMTDMIASTENEPGVLAYEWYFNAEETECAIFERHKDSDAVAAHFGNFAAFAERFGDACEQKQMIVLGHPERAARAFLDAANPAYFSARAGFAKFAT